MRAPWLFVHQCRSLPGLPEVVEVVEGEGEVPHPPPHVVLLEEHGLRLGRLALHEVGEGAAVGELHDDAQRLALVVDEEAAQADDVLAVQLDQGDHLLHRLLVIVTDPLDSTSHPIDPLLEDCPEGTLAYEGHAQTVPGCGQGGGSEITY